MLLSGAYITKAQNKVYGIVQVNDESFSTNDVFIYDSNNKFLTTPMISQNPFKSHKCQKLLLKI